MNRVAKKTRDEITGDMFKKALFNLKHPGSDFNGWIESYEFDPHKSSVELLQDAYYDGFERGLSYTDSFLKDSQLLKDLFFALEFYANKNNWKNKVPADKGVTANKALNKHRSECKW